MATLLKMPDPATALSDQSTWDLLLTGEDLDEITRGSVVSLHVILPISQPSATIRVRKAP